MNLSGTKVLQQQFPRHYFLPVKLLICRYSSLFFCLLERFSSTICNFARLFFVLPDSHHRTSQTRTLGEISKHRNNTPEPRNPAAGLFFPSKMEKPFLVPHVK